MTGGLLRRGDQQTLATLALMALLAGAGWWWTQRERLVDASAMQHTPAAFVVDVNRAPWMELAQLPGVGETLARRMVEYRQEHGPFHSLEQLRQVRGMGPKTFEKIAGHLTVEPLATATPRDRN